MKQDILNKLTPREQQVVAELVARPQASNADIAAALGIETGTVRTHLNSIYEKLDLKTGTRSQWARWNLVMLLESTGDTHQFRCTCGCDVPVTDENGFWQPLPRRSLYMVTCTTCGSTIAVKQALPNGETHWLDSGTPTN